MNEMNSGVVGFANNATNEFEAGCFRLKGEKVESFENTECCCSLRIDCCRGVPFGTKKLEVWFLGGLAAAVVEVDFMNTVVINDHELVTKGSLWADTVLPQAVAELNTKTQCFQGLALEELPSPALERMRIQFTNEQKQ